MHFTRTICVLLFWAFCSATGLRAQVVDTARTSIALTDTLKADSSKVVSSSPISSNAVKSKVEYDASDSMRVDINEQKIFLYGDASVIYSTSTLKAAYIEMNMKTNIVYAEGKVDTAGNLIGQPEFTDAGQTFQARTMTYNFDTKKGKIQDVMTHEGDGYLHGETVKKDSSDNFYIKHGKYTTCDLPHPHFYIGASKLKVIKDDKIVTGPANLVIEDIPTPLAVPFGFFPNKKGRANGIKMPEYGDSPGLGFFLKEGGYYFGVNDYVDMLLTGDIYSKGSYGLAARSNYRKRYKYDGDISLKYSKIKLGEKGFREFSEQNNFFVNWSHQQDQKARPGSTFMADVNAGSSNYNKFSSNNSLDYLSNVFTSSIRYTNNNEIGGYSIGARHDQNTLTKDVNIYLPEFTYNLNRIYPVRKITNSTITKNTWYNNIAFSYVANAQNVIRTKDSLLLEPVTFDRMRNGITHQIPLTTSVKFLKYFDFSPSATYNETWYFKTVRNRWEGTTVDRKDTANFYRLLTDTIEGFDRINTINYNSTVRTTLYGMYQLKSKTVKAIRHVITPTAGFNYSPGSTKGNYYLLNPYDTLKPNLVTYSIYDSSLYGRPVNVRSANITFGINNNLEMKVHPRKDTLATDKKIMLFDQLNFTSEYNLLADSFQLQQINFLLSSRIANKLDILINGSVDPYAYDYIKKRRDKDKFEFTKSNKIGNLQNAQLRLSFNLNHKRNEPKKSEKGTEQQLEDINRNLGDYVDFTIPWNLRLEYIIGYQKSYIPYILVPNKHSDFTQTLGFNGDVNITTKWKIGFNSGYDFLAKQLSYTSVDIYRDLHCWEMRFHWIPYGLRKSYSIDINVKSAMLQDLKLSRRRDWYDLR